ncbi:hypothetical protein Tco_1266822 [Tanacetum coccineum]
MLDSYTSAICTDSRGRSSYARAMVELQDDVKLKDTFVVALPKVVGEGYNMSIIHVEKLVLVNDDGKPLKSIMEKMVNMSSVFMPSTYRGTIGRVGW